MVKVLGNIVYAKCDTYAVLYEWQRILEVTFGLGQA